MKKLLYVLHFKKQHILCLFVLLLSVVGLSAQKVSGIIKDSKNSEPIVGASVLLKGTVTDEKGNFTLALDKAETNGDKPTFRTPFQFFQ